MRVLQVMRRLGTVSCVLAGVMLASLAGRASHAATAAAPSASRLTRVADLPVSARPGGVPTDYVVTPNGYFDPSCVVTVNAGERLQSNGLIRRVDGRLEKPAACTKAHYTLGGVEVSPNGARALMRPIELPEQSGWVQAANYASSTPIGRIVASWEVPTNPSNDSDQVIFFFPGLEQLPNVQSILQPVLGWNGYGDHAWTLASWNCCKDGTTFHSAPIAAHAGDQVVGDTYSNCAAGVACSSWNIDSRDVTTGQTTTLTTDPYADLTWVFGGVLEVYNVSTCNEYPGGPITFHDIAVYDRNGVQVASPPWNGADTSGIDPQCNYGLQTTASTATIAY